MAAEVVETEAEVVSLAAAAKATVEVGSSQFDAIEAMIDIACAAVVTVASFHNLHYSVVVAQGFPFVYDDSAHSSLWGK